MSFIVAAEVTRLILSQFLLGSRVAGDRFSPKTEVRQGGTGNLPVPSGHWPDGTKASPGVA